MTPIGRLIREQRAKGMTLREMEKRAGKAGYPLGHSSFSSWERNPSPGTFPDPNTWHAFAHGLNLPLSVVTDAILETFGIRKSLEPTTQWTIYARRGSELPKRRADELARRLDSWFDELDE